MYGLKAEGLTNVVLVSVVLWDLLVIRKNSDSANLILQQTNAGKLTKIKGNPAVSSSHLILYQ